MCATCSSRVENHGNSDGYSCFPQARESRMVLASKTWIEIGAREFVYFLFFILFFD